MINSRPFKQLKASRCAVLTVFAGLLVASSTLAGQTQATTSAPDGTNALPGIPQGLTVTAGNGSVTLAWDDPADPSIAWYEYMRWEGAAWGPWTSMTGSDSATTSHTVEGLANGTEYRFHVRAVNAAARPGRGGPYAPPWYVAATPGSPPAAPTGLTASAGDGQVTFEWDDPADPSIAWYEYIMRWQGVAWGPWTSMAGSDSVTTSHTVEGLTNGTEYRFRVRAVNTGGSGPHAPNAHPWYVAATPAASTMTADSVAATSATLSISNWNTAWYYRPDDASSADCAGPAQGATATLTGLDPATDYSYSAFADAECAMPIATGTAFQTTLQALAVKVHRTFDHDPQAFTQGLLWHGGKLYESIGLYGQSGVREVDPETGGVLRTQGISSWHFGEGLALHGDRLVMLTWQGQQAYVFDRADFRSLGTETYVGEGWGLCHDGARFVMSNGSASLTFRDTDTFAVIGTVQVTAAGQPVVYLNELECVDGAVYANVWFQDHIVRINPANGRVTARIEAAGLVDEDESTGDNVLNGIAFNPETGRFYITGKRWSKMFEVTFE